jgi:hypothetical protein
MGGLLMSDMDLESIVRTLSEKRPVSTPRPTFSLLLPFTSGLDDFKYGYTMAYKRFVLLEGGLGVSGSVIMSSGFLRA